MDLIGKWSSFLPEKSLSFKLGKFDLTFSYWQLALIALLVFLLFLSFGAGSSDVSSLELG